MGVKCMFCGDVIKQEKGLVNFARGTIDKLVLIDPKNTSEHEMIGKGISFRLQYKDPWVCEKCGVMFPTKMKPQ